MMAFIIEPRESYLLMSDIEHKSDKREKHRDALNKFFWDSENFPSDRRSIRSTKFVYDEIKQNKISKGSFNIAYSLWLIIFLLNMRAQYIFFNFGNAKSM